MNIMAVVLAIILLTMVIAVPVIALKMHASKPGLLADAQEAQALLGLLQKARETFPKNSCKRRELYQTFGMLRMSAGSISLESRLDGQRPLPGSMSLLWAYPGHP